MEFLRVENLYKTFNNIKAVDGIGFEVRGGEIFGLLGPNGAGKSTTISMISTLFHPTGGDILFKGKSILKEPAALRRKLGLVPQDIALYPTLTGYENLSFWGSIYGIRGKALKQRISEVAEVIGINDRLKDRVDKYSGGMKRRLNIGAALLHKPELLIMDEPTVGIDPQSRNHILDTVLELNRQGMTIIYTSHYMEEAEYLCSRLCIMDKGKIIASGTTEELVGIINGQSQVSMKLDKVNNELLESVKKIKGIRNAEIVDGNVVVSGENVDLAFTDIVSQVSEAGRRIISIDVNRPDLEAVFLHLTGRALRD